MDFHERNEWYWRNLLPTDLKYLTQKRRVKRPCSWCGRRGPHAPLCQELHDSWMPTLKRGRYAGHKLNKCPVDYLRFIVRGKEDTEWGEVVLQAIEMAEREQS